jgi:hypothetical protein
VNGFHCKKRTFGGLGATVCSVSLGVRLMLIEIKYVEASELLWDMFRELPESVQKRFSERVNKVSSVLDQPSLGFSHIVGTVGSDRTCEPPVRGGSIVLPLQRAEVPDGIGTP